MPALYNYPSCLPELFPKYETEIFINQFFPPLLIVNHCDIAILLNYFQSYYKKTISAHQIQLIILEFISHKSLIKDKISSLILKFFINLLFSHLTISNVLQET